MFVAVLIVVVIFILLQRHYNSVSKQYDQVADEAPPLINNIETNTEDPVEADEGMSLKDLNLSDSQQDMVEKLGIDVDTFVITKEMIECAENKLGKERYQAILAGSAPTFFESLSLVACY
ncbi:hypothetical protein KC723_02785 [Candidatus Kaiserbacteria bacterium]|nr:hypothetical protein [Candidatus Kaiserbacteria bacterium]